MSTSTPFQYSSTVDAFMCKCAACTAVHSVQVHPLFSCFCSALKYIPGIIRKAVVPGTKCSAVHLRSNYCNTASIIHQVRAVVFHGGGARTSVPGLVHFLEKSSTLITRTPVLMSYARVLYIRMQDQAAIESKNDCLCTYSLRYRTFNSSSMHVSPIYLRSSCHTNKNTGRNISGYPEEMRVPGYPVVNMAIPDG